MFDSIDRTELFPTLLFQAHIQDPEGFNARLLDAIYLEREQDQEGIARSNFTRLGGWHSAAAIHQKPEFAMLASLIRDACQHISADLQYDTTSALDIESMWAIINAPGASNRAHIHPEALWSGVYYVKAEADAGNIEFTDPRTANLMRQPRFSSRPGICDPAKMFTPTAGRMLIFPSWLYHMVHPNFSGQDRVIVSFNLSQGHRRP